MRTELLVWALTALASLARADVPILAIAAEKALYVDEASSLTMRLALPSDAAAPLLVTVHAEGSALEVVRGRVSRSDAREEHHGELVFAIPVVGRATGSAVIRAQVRFYQCMDGCAAREATAMLVVDVRAR